MNETRLNGNLKRYFSAVAKEGLWSSRGNGSLQIYLNYLFQDVTFPEKSMIDIGCGSGLYSFYAATKGAESIVCLEPEAKGCTREVTQKFIRISGKLGLNNVRLERTRFQDFDDKHQEFDIILLHNSINHIDEGACERLKFDNQARSRYHTIFGKLSKLAASGSRLLIADCSRHNIFGFLHLKNTFAPDIEWHKHQSPEFWSTLLAEHGFTNPRIRWLSFGALLFSRSLLNNKFVSYLSTSHFLLVMDKNARRTK